MALPAYFDRSNFVWKGFKHPETGEIMVHDLHVFRHRRATGQPDLHGDASMSCWQLSWKERLSILWHGKVWLWVMGQHPQISVDGITPRWNDPPKESE